MHPSPSNRFLYCTNHGCFMRDGHEDELFDFDDGDAHLAPSCTGSFDFARYLTSLTSEEWKIDELAGGNANHTVRATKLGITAPVPLEPLGQRLEQYSSVVMKYAPPYFHKSPEMKFDPYRQTIEARALAALHDPASPLYCVKQATDKDVSVPVLIDHSPHHNVLIQSDLGNLPTIDKFLLSPQTTLSQAAKSGKLLGSYLVELHRSVSFTTDNIRNETLKLEQSLLNSYVEPTMVAVINNVENYMKIAGIPDYEILAKRARDHWRNRTKSIFGQGDIWFGTVLIDAEAMRLGICDWEFAGPNHPAADIAQFGAYLHLSALSPLLNDQQRVLVCAFSNAFYSTYFKDLDTIVDDMEDFKRSLTMFHGWELINAAAWRQYLWSECKQDETNLSTHCIEMVRLGAVLLRAVGDHGVDWKELQSMLSELFRVTLGE